ncbi:hypothetical protein [Devosia chinhatensis]|uniref:Uncharacterized protein n=1 Tax=Devosia chinhatensis TaxID=429727 RepID=A0A0F5FJX7_9HYPH|nr:hypothetical protein [Devosia chinhatensis]KKB09194.1 hypothetical protein VE26_04160 [Devosia chinhatensis]
MTKLTAFLIERDGEPDLQFTGEVVGCGFAHDHQAGGVTRSTMVRLFRTEADNWIAEIVVREEFAGMRNTVRSAASVSDTAEGLVGFFGNGRAAKALYASVGSILPRPCLFIE